MGSLTTLIAEYVRVTYKEDPNVNLAKGFVYVAGAFLFLMIMSSERNTEHGTEFMKSNLSVACIHQSLNSCTTMAPVFYFPLTDHYGSCYVI